MNYEQPTQAEINAYIDRAHQMRAQVTRDAFVAAINWVRGLFAGAAHTA